MPASGPCWIFVEKSRAKMIYLPFHSAASAIIRAVWQPVRSPVDLSSCRWGVGALPTQSVRSRHKLKAGALRQLGVAETLGH